MKLSKRALSSTKRDLPPTFCYLHILFLKTYRKTRKIRLALSWNITSRFQLDSILVMTNSSNKIYKNKKNKNSTTKHHPDCIMQCTLLTVIAKEFLYCHIQSVFDLDRNFIY